MPKKDNLFIGHMRVVKEGSIWFREGLEKDHNKVRVTLMILISLICG